MVEELIILFAVNHFVDTDVEKYEFGGVSLEGKLNGITNPFYAFSNRY